MQLQLKSRDSASGSGHGMQRLLLRPDNQHAAHLCVLAGQSQSAECINHCCIFGERGPLPTVDVRNSDPHVLYTN